MMSQPSLWERVKSGSKTGFDKTWKAMDKLGAPVNKLSNKLGSEAFWPTTLDKESDKAARILKSFCKDGFYAEEERQPDDGPTQRQKVLKKIPAEVIKNAKGLAIFTTMRTGLWISGAGGSGVLIARKEDGSWSPPSGILLHTAGLGFLIGVDIYDCVVVINTTEALEAFTKLRCTLGSEISIAAGPVGAGGILESEVHKRRAPIFTYLKSRGFYAGVQIDGTVIIERSDENERFYGQRLPVKEILDGKVRHPPFEIRRLLETIKSAQGDTDIDDSMLPTEAPPGDYEVDDGHLFGVPDKEDPDPYGVLALEKEGMSIKEAGTQKRASWEAFSFNPAPRSPVHEMYSRNSLDRSRTVGMRSSWRSSALNDESKISRSVRNSLERPQTPAQYSDSGTQTELDNEESPHRLSMRGRASRRSSKASFAPSGMQEVPEHDVLSTAKHDPESTSNVNGYSTPPHTPPLHNKNDDGHVHDEIEHEDDDDAHIEEPIVRSVQSVQSTAPQVISKARIVNVPKRGPPPKLPPRNPYRGSGSAAVDAFSKDSGRTSSQSPGPYASAHEVSPVNDVDVDPMKRQFDGINLKNSDDEDDDVGPDLLEQVEETTKGESHATTSQSTSTTPGEW